MSKRVFLLAPLFLLAATCSAVHAGFSLVYHPDDLFFEQDPAIPTLFNVLDYENEINVGGGTAGVLEVGDRLRGIGNITHSYDAVGNLRLPTNFELTALFDVTIAKVTPNPLGSGAALFEFVPTAGFATEVGGPAGAMIAFYYDAVVGDGTEFDATQSLAASEADATDGSKYLVLGARGDWGDADADGVGYYWAANGSDGTNPGINPYGGAFFSASLDLLYENTKFVPGDFYPITQIQPQGFPSALGLITNKFGIQGNTSPDTAGLYPAYAITSNDPLTCKIPEPSILVAVIGLAVMGLSIGYRRMRKA